MITEAFARSGEQVTNSLHHAGTVLNSAAEGSNFSQSAAADLLLVGIVTGVSALVFREPLVKHTRILIQDLQNERRAKKAKKLKK